MPKRKARRDTVLAVFTAHLTVCLAFDLVNVLPANAALLALNVTPKLTLKVYSTFPSLTGTFSVQRIPPGYTFGMHTSDSISICVYPGYIMIYGAHTVQAYVYLNGRSDSRLRETME